MLSCKEVNELATRSLGQRLPWRERMAIRVHILMCKTCQRVTKQMKFINKATGQLVDREHPFMRLPLQARKRIQNTLKQEKHHD